MSHWRFWTNCETGQRVWRWFPRVGRPERSIVWPCAKAGALAVPLAIGPVAFTPPYFVPGAAPPAVFPPVPPAPPAWHEGQGFYIPPREGSEFSPYVSPNGTSPIFTELSPTPGEIITPPLGREREIPPTETAVPEPASVALLAIGAGVAVWVRRRGA